MSLHRREFLARTSVGLASGALLASGATLGCASSGAASGGAGGPLIVSTWPFGKAANDVALAVLQRGGSLLDAVEQGIGHTEASGNESVGLTGLPNAAGVAQLDACIMEGVGHRAGSVAALEGIRHPISAARRVMEKTPHVMLVGEGARRFALEEGLESLDAAALAEAAAKNAAWWQARPAGGGGSSRSPADGAPRIDAANHDTIALLVLGADGHVAGGCSTSGLSGKRPGRVGDSPILGAGLYVDDEVGAAGATGLGENVMRWCGSFLVVELMRQGASPEEACLEAIRRIARKDPRGADLSISFVALDKAGRYGAAGSASGFEYSVTTASASRVLTGAALSAAAIGPIGGNRK
ncbi:MAG: N(4)-(beta-N-acetylglucosaminyl)-L-asparaginase [Planctomycetes bacterium]|nr:N(4)-(beta-N-acetylglucosaminyl)-L-asparaginase [Planctomycetota bacterium]